MTTVADALMAEITRVRDAVLPGYLDIGASGAPAAAMMRAEMDAAVRALAYQDAIECIRLLASLRKWES